MANGLNSKQADMGKNDRVLSACNVLQYLQFDFNQCHLDVNTLIVACTCARHALMLSVLDHLKKMEVIRFLAEKAGKPTAKRGLGLGSSWEPVFIM